MYYIFRKCITFIKLKKKITNIIKNYNFSLKKIITDYGAHFFNKKKIMCTAKSLINTATFHKK